MPTNKRHAACEDAAIRTIFAQPGAEHAREQLDTIAHMLGRQLPKVGIDAARSQPARMSPVVGVARSGQRKAASSKIGATSSWRSNEEKWSVRGRVIR